MTRAAGIIIISYIRENIMRDEGIHVNSEEIAKAIGEAIGKTSNASKNFWVIATHVTGKKKISIECVQGTKEDIKEHIMSAMRDKFKKYNMNMALGHGLINEVDDYLVAGVNISGAEYMSISARPVQMQPAVQINLATLNFDASAGSPLTFSIGNDNTYNHKPY